MLKSIFVLLMLTLVSLGGRLAYAQDPPNKQTGGKSDLTEGLMDLLREPAKETSNKPLNSQPANQPKTADPNNQIPIDGEDIGKGARHPLADVQLEMSTLANWLRGRPDVLRTKELQRNVVLRLDEMIEQLEKQTPSPSNSAASPSQSSSSQQQSPADSSTDAQSSGGQQIKNSDRSMPNDSSQSKSNSDAQTSAEANRARPRQGQGSNEPGQSNGDNDAQQTQSQPGVSPIRSRAVNVDLNDPRALQRSAWGNLPERTREQMQSRMVERFLPPYRDEIEAYYRALVK